MLHELNSERIQYIFRNMDDSVCITGMGGELLYANPAAEKLFGLRTGDRPKLWEAIPYVEGNDELIQLFIDSVMEKRKSFSALVDYVNNEGKLFRLHVSLTCEPSDPGLFLVVISDLTQSVRVKSAFERYTSEDIADYVLTTPDGEKQGGKAQEVTILMSDLRGFTAMSTRLSSTQLVSVLNHYFESMSAVIERHRGTIIEFLGDGIFVVFGAPKELPDHASAAVRCAIEMQNAMEAVNAWNRENGYPELDMGIGVNTGTVVVGNIGSEKKMKYGCMGEAVNLAGRLESFTVGGQVFISESTRDRASEEVAVISESSFLPKGASQDMRFYDISGIGSCKLKNASDASAWITLSGKTLAFYVLEEKTVDHTEHTGSLTRISADNRFALLSTCSKLKPFQNLMLRIGGRDTYAKIVSQEGNEFRLCFTSVPENFPDLVKML